MQSRQIPVPVCLWRDAGGIFGACLAERPTVSAVGAHPREVLGQLQDYLEWSYEVNPYLPEPDFFDPELQHFAVEVYPEYRSGDKIFPGADAMVLLVPSLIGRTGAGQQLVSLPLQKLVFYCYEPASLKKLVTHFVQQNLQGKTPDQLSREFSPPEIRIEQFMVKSQETTVNLRRQALPEELLQVAEPLGDRAARRQFGRAWEREVLVRQLADWLRNDKTPVLLVGQAGVGKTTLLAEAVRELERKHPGSETEADTGSSQAPRFWLSSAGRLIAGMQYLGQWQARCEALIEALAGLQGTLCIDNLRSLIQTGGTGSLDSLAAFFQPFLQFGELRMVAEATPAELDACRRLMPGLVELFRILSVPAMDKPTALKVMDRLQSQLQKEGGAEIERGTLEQVWHLFHRFAPYSPFPGQPVRFLQQLLEGASPPAKVNALDAVRLFSERTGMPERLLRDDMPLSYESVLAELQTRVSGQPEACAAAARILTLFKAGLNDPQRPIAVLLFCGPTGVGKTALTRAMADFLQGGRLIRLDMSEYAGPLAATRLLTGSQGEPAEWLQKIRQQPFQVLLFDEIEKAHPDVFDVLLGIFDEGRLTDSFGRTLHFQSCLIVLTSNLGADAPAALGFGASSSPDYSKAVQAFFRPELFNRLDAVLPFVGLDPAAMARIAGQELHLLAQREGLLARELRLDWTPDLVAYLARIGFEPLYGARPLQRAIENEVAAPLAHYLLKHADLRACELMLDWQPEKGLIFSARADQAL